MYFDIILKDFKKGEIPGYTNLQYFAPRIFNCSEANARPTRTKTKLNQLKIYELDGQAV